MQRKEQMLLKIVVPKLGGCSPIKLRVCICLLVIHIDALQFLIIRIFFYTAFCGFSFQI